MDLKNQYQQDFLWVTYFGVTKSEVKNDVETRISRCAERAYLDLNRTIRYRLSTTALNEMKKAGEGSDAEAFEDEKEKFRQAVREHLIKKIKVLLGKQDIERDWFDEKWHKPTCQRIMRLANDEDGLIKEGEHFTFGQAQKWVNMTLKNLLVMGIDDLRAIVPVMHVPLDSYIIKAASVKPKERIHESFDVKGLGVKRLSGTWSGLNNPKEYIEYQKRIRNMLGNGKYPIYWEGPAWIAQAKVEAEKNLSD